MLHDPLALLALGAAALATALLLWFLIRRPALTHVTKVILLFAMGVLPLITATSGNVAAFEATKTREFCGGCHVMVPYAQDSVNLASESLSAKHSRNEAFGKENCYTCHADYGMFGTVVTKIGGLRHIYYQLTEYQFMTVEEALPTIHLREGVYSNTKCMRCHSTTGPAWNLVGDHAGLLQEIREDRIGCTSDGCHGPVHAFSKVGR
jgi:nitrate/TMAO reductase-like tetraheme cytochrome c subunit